MISKYSCYICKNCFRFYVENINLSKKPLSFKVNGTIHQSYNCKLFCSKECCKKYTASKAQVRREFNNIKKYGVKTNLILKSNIEKSKETCLKKYGVEYSFQSENNKRKSKETCFRKYGKEFANQSEIVRAKQVNTNIKKYGGVGFASSDLRDKYEETCLKKYGVNHSSKSLEIINKINYTKLSKYGNLNNYSKIKNTILEKYGDLIYQKTEDYRIKTRNTNLDKYRVEWGLQSSIIRGKIENTNLEKYGVRSPLSSEFIRDKIRKTNVLKYGTENPFSSNIIKSKIKEVNLNKYGVIYPSQLDSVKLKILQTKKDNLSSLLKLDINKITKDILNQNTGFGKIWRDNPDKIREIKIKNLHNIIPISIVDIVKNLKEFESKLNNKEVRLPVGHSLDEFYFYKYLIQNLKFYPLDIEWCYTDNRYPFECDFYVKSLDLFIELNFFWTHGDHKFDKSDKLDIEKLESWKKKSETSEFYKVAIGTWMSDLRKFEYAEKNNLNYIAFYSWREIYDYFNVY